MVGPPLVGIILDKTNGSNDNEKSYTLAFVCAIIFSVFTAFSIGIVNPKFHKPASKIWKKSSELVKNLNIMLFFALLITMGSVAGFQTTYRNWYLKELGASDLLTGIISGVDALYGIPFLCKSKWCINKVGVRHVFILGLLGHVVYSFSFSAMEEPWIALIIESTTILSYHLFWVAVIQYSDEIAPDGLVAIMKILAGSLHYNIGKLGSTFVGGYVMNTYGGRTAFTVLGCIALAYTFVYGSYLIIQRLKQKKVRITLESPSAKEIPEENPNFT
ncbi:hypothetical protein AVEN_120220-1 [Araneus ventricosus]|uniref:Major facilitator superfamily associated domain-containing protein n=1 Tax=Araneus ventricosus TaxID=182803 RepID=A0A4Y2J427_ARAVE|nr:hypothetical protein AVEN_120220-1 [Araneus ventricosus]